MGPHWEHFHHEADIGVRGYGHNMAEAFEQAALAMTAIITEPGSIRPESMIGLSRFELDPELLFVDWLNAIVYENDVDEEQHMALVKGDIDPRDLAMARPGQARDHQRSRSVSDG